MSLASFMAYAQDFEKTYVDDDWSRLTRYFTADAVYEVKGSPFACTLRGRDAIFRGIKKSLDGFDRRFAKREIGVTTPPKEEGDTVIVDWSGSYARPGSPPLAIRGQSLARYAGDEIVYLSDTYAADNVAASAEWMRKHGAGLDGTYV